MYFIKAMTIDFTLLTLEVLHQTLYDFCPDSFFQKMTLHAQLLKIIHLPSSCQYFLKMEVRTLNKVHNQKIQKSINVGLNETEY